MTHPLCTSFRYQESCSVGEGGGQGREGAGTATPDASKALEAWTRGMAERQKKTGQNTCDFSPILPLGIQK